MTQGPDRKILLFADWYPPAYKAGGPIRSCENVVLHLHSLYDIYVFTGNSDLNEQEPMPGIKEDNWTVHSSGAKVYYASAASQTWTHIRTLIAELQPEFVYMNSMFSLKFTIFPILMHRMGMIDAKLFLSPRGMLKTSALAFKSQKKKLYIKLLNATGIAKRIQFVASDAQEAKEVNNSFPGVRIETAPNFPGKIGEAPLFIMKKPGNLSILFIGRIHPIKNLDILLKSIPVTNNSIDLTIAGLLENPAYWEECKRIIAQFPPNVRVTFKGDLPHHQLIELYQTHHILVLPTQGENFGHAIFESLSAGRPVIISDQTPWRKLQNHNAGWDLPLEIDAFQRAIHSALHWDQSQYDLYSAGAYQLALNYINNSSLIERYKQIFN